VSEEKFDSVTELVAYSKTALAEVLAKALVDVKGDIAAYTQQVVQEFGRYLYRAYRDGDQVAAENLRDLRAQVMLIAVKREIVIQHDAMEKLGTIIEWLARFAVALLLKVATK
jgi:hypothetical protein